MAKKKFWVGILVMVLIFTVVLNGCATTYSINYASAEQPAGNYKYVTISANSSGASVLQRFYSDYPGDIYEVVAVELLRKHYLPILAGLGGCLLGGSLGTIFTLEYEDSFASVIGMSTGAVILAPIGYLIGDFFKDKYIVTYVERSRSAQNRN